MVEYRTILKDYHRDELLKRYKKHVDVYGGLFTSTARQNLLGINPKNPQPYQDTPNFWSDVRKTVKNGLIDLQLICAVAHPKQLKKMFQTIPIFPNAANAEITTEQWYALSPNITAVISSIIPSFPIYDNMDEDLPWRIEIAKRLTEICLEFFDKNNLIRSPVHLRHLQEVKLILDAELSYLGTSGKIHFSRT